MNKNIFNRLLAVASLAMMAAAKEQKIVDVNELMLRGMNANDKTFEMSRDETLTLLMDYSAGWELESLIGAPYTVEERYQCTAEMSECSVAWDINYDSLISNPAVVDTKLHFLD